MRILHTIQSLASGGLEDRTLDTMAWQANHGHDVVLAGAPNSRTVQRAQAAGIAVEHVTFRSGLRPRVISQLRQAIQRQRIDVVDTHCNRDSSVALFCTDLCAIVRTRHSKNRQPKRSFWRRMRWWAAYDHVIATATAIADELIEEGVTLPQHTSMIGEWAGENFFADAENRTLAAKLRGGLGLRDDVLTIGTVGMMRREKGFDHLIRAMARLRDRGLEANCVIVGGGDDGITGELKVLTRELNLEDRVVFTGYRQDVAPLMHVFDVMVVPSLRESQTRVVPQAFACGRPVVAYATGGVPELIADGVTGWLSPTGDVAHLADRIYTAATQPELRSAVAVAARNYASDNMRLGQKMEQTIAAYERAIARAGTDRFVRPLSLSASASLSSRLSLPTSWPIFWPSGVRKSAS
jgi:glycosyltransferase involved in cell wall biosynthesis